MDATPPPNAALVGSTAFSRTARRSHAGSARTEGLAGRRAVPPARRPRHLALLLPAAAALGTALGCAPRASWERDFTRPSARGTAFTASQTAAERARAERARTTASERATGDAAATAQRPAAGTTPGATDTTRAVTDARPSTGARDATRARIVIALDRGRRVPVRPGRGGAGATGDAPPAALIIKPPPSMDGLSPHRSAPFTLVPSAPRTLLVHTGPNAQALALDELLGTATRPAELTGLDLPAGHAARIWADGADELLAAPADAGIAISLGGGVPNDTDRRIVGLLRDRGWRVVEIDVVGAAVDPEQVATAAMHVVEALVGVHRHRKDAVGPPVLVLGFGIGTEVALQIMHDDRLDSAAGLLVSSRPHGTGGLDADVPLLHLAPGRTGPASVREILAQSRVQADATAPAAPTRIDPGETRWTFSLRPTDDAAWLPTLVEPSVAWLEQAAEAARRDAEAAVARHASAF